jgi:hypothetical protein
MINTGPTNHKIYDRCVFLISDLTGCSVYDAETCLIRAIYEKNVVPGSVRDLPVVEHIKEYNPKSDDDRMVRQIALPLGILLAAGRTQNITVEEGKRAILDEPVVRKAIVSAIIL